MRATLAGLSHLAARTRQIPGVCLLAWGLSEVSSAQPLLYGEGQQGIRSPRAGGGEWEEKARGLEGTTCRRP
jgi:hypothetical protein